MTRRHSYTLSSAFPPPPPSVVYQSRRLSRVGLEEREANCDEPSWGSSGAFVGPNDYSTALPAYRKARAVCNSAVPLGAKRTEVTQLPSSTLPSPPASPTESNLVGYRRDPLSYTPSSQSTSSQVRDISTSIADQRSHLPLTPPYETFPLLETVSSNDIPSVDHHTRRSHPPSSHLNCLSSSRPCLTPSSSDSTAASKRSSFVKRKPVPQYEEEVDIVDDPLWDGRALGPTSANKMAAPSSVLNQMRRLSMDEQSSSSSRRASSIGHGLSDLRQPQTGVSSKDSSLSTRRFSYDTDERSIQSISSRTGPPSTTPTSPALEDCAPSAPPTSHAYPFPSRPTSKRPSRPFALIRREQPQSMNALAALVPSLSPEPSSATRAREHDELDAWMAIMGGGDRESEGQAPKSFTRPAVARSAKEHARRSSSRLSFSERRISDGEVPVNPFFSFVPPLVYAPSPSPSRDSSFLARPQHNTRPRRMLYESGSRSTSDASYEDELDSSAEGSTEDSPTSTVDEYVDACSSRRPSFSSMSSSHTEGSLIEKLEDDHYSAQGLASMAEVDEPPTPNPNHLVGITPKVGAPPSPLVTSLGSEVAGSSLFGTFAWSSSSSSHTSSVPSFGDSLASVGRTPSTSASSTSSVSIPTDSKRRPSQTPRPPKPPKSPRRGSRVANDNKLHVQSDLIGVGTSAVSL